MDSDFYYYYGGDINFIRLYTEHITYQTAEYSDLREEHAASNIL